MKLYFRKLGEQGTPIIILHGIFGSSDNWVNIGKVLAETHQVFLLDQRNHGQSPWSDEFDYMVMAADLKEFIEDHQLQNPILIGHSMGGKVVMQFELNYPALAQKVIIVDIAPKYYPVHHTQILNGLNSLDLKNLQSRTEANEHLKRFEEKEGVRQFLLKNLYRNSENEFAFRINLKVITKNIDVVGHELFIKNPSETFTYFIKGSDSHYILPEDERYISEIFPNFEIIEITNAGHWVQADQPEAFVKAVQQIL
ncbi:alpha/beta fold hydrolase [Sandaracinomonas limnophila]|uniref:Alpha/beta fold hydrolase n=1 Tax=Sandaracinomonas limnophila TaxID=1862386 RepID=A0A437PQU2_9BACT|nr:alpha/beta fold hydrolase [Sandaracinomonas limnophila]RVU24617.1 alpha/beta fold hydrolase [Sandaracinomonas limnophila]